MISSTVIDSAVVVGVEAIPVRIEVDLTRRLPATTIVGLPPVAAKETIARVRSAIEASGYEYPKGRVTVNVKPAQFTSAPGLDLPIALAILTVSEQIPLWDLRELTYFIGELSLNGDVRPMREIVAVASQLDLGETLVAYDAVAARRHTGGGYAWDVATLGGAAGKRPDSEATRIRREDRPACKPRGMLLLGPPGCGKTLLAHQIAKLMPGRVDLSIYSAAGLLAPNDPAPTGAPFRAPHHTISVAGVIGDYRPGECALAHDGVLFLDEADEFSRAVLECIVEAWKQGQITRKTKNYDVTFPSHFALILAVTPGVGKERKIRELRALVGEDNVFTFGQQTP